MKNLINIASDDKSLYVDPASITVVTNDPRSDGLSIGNEKGYFLNARKENLDIIIRKLAEAGNALIPFSEHYNDQEYTHYIAPSAVTFTAVSEVRKNGNIGVTIGVKGTRHLESNRMKPEEFKALLDGIKKTGKNLLEYKPSNLAKSTIYIDPAAMKEIRDDGFQVNVSFEGSDRINIRTSDSSRRDERADELFNKFWNERRSEFKNERDCLIAAKQQAEQEENQARIDFANRLAAANGTLTQVKNDDIAVHIRPDEFAYVLFHDDDREDTEGKYHMMLCRQDQRDSVTLHYGSAAARSEAFDALMSDMNRKEMNSSLRRAGGMRLA